MAEDRKARLAQTSHWDELLALRDRQRERAWGSIQVIKQSELPLEVSRQGLMRWYMHPGIKDTALSVLMFFQQEIPSGSRLGRLKFQGGQGHADPGGQGYTLIDGVKHPWKAGDLLNLPLRSTASSCSISTPTRSSRGIRGGRAELARLRHGRSRLRIQASSRTLPNAADESPLKTKVPSMAETERVRGSASVPLSQ